VIATGSMAKFLPGGFTPWEFVTVIWGERHLRHMLLILYGVLQWRENTPLSDQGCTDTAACSG